MERCKQWGRVMGTDTGDREASDGGFFLFRTNRRWGLCDSSNQPKLL